MRETLKGTDKRALKNPTHYILDQTTESKAEDSFDYAKNSVQVVNVLFFNLQVSDPEVIKDMFDMKKAQINRPEIVKGCTYNWSGNLMILVKTDDSWRAKRKAIAHTFFKNQLIAMLDKLKHYTMEAQKRWLEEIRASKDGSTKINMTTEVLKIQQNFLMHIVFGKNVEAISVKIQNTDPKSEQKFFEQNLGEANETLAMQQLQGIYTRILNPLWRFGWNYFGQSWAFTSGEKVADVNALNYRAAVRDYIQKFKSGEVKSDLADDSDMMSQMLKAPHIYSDEDIIDEVVDFLTAGTMTTQYSL